jgi:hypothetical protein
MQQFGSHGGRWMGLVLPAIYRDIDGEIKEWRHMFHCTKYTLQVLPY